MTEEIELKPCPFCGGKATLVYVDDEEWQVICEDCGSCSDCYYEECSYDNPPEWKKVIKAWNDRQIEDAQAEEIKRMREALELIAKEKFYFARGEEEKQIRRVCEIAEEALKGGEE